MCLCFPILAVLPLIAPSGIRSLLWFQNTLYLILAMILNGCNYSQNESDGLNTGFCIAIWQMGIVAALGFVMFMTILILSICLCRVYKRVKKLKRLEVITDNPEDAELHYAELQNLPESSRGQCDGGTCPTLPTVQSSDYATVAELKGSIREEDFNQEEKEDSGLDDEQKENESLLGQE